MFVTEGCTKNESACILCSVGLLEVNYCLVFIWQVSAVDLFLFLLSTVLCHGVLSVE